MFYYRDLEQIEDEEPMEEEEVINCAMEESTEVRDLRKPYDSLTTTRPDENFFK